MVNVVTELARQDVLSELLLGVNVFMMSVTITGFRNKFSKWKEALESMFFKVDLGKTNVMVSGGTTNDRSSKRRVDT